MTARAAGLFTALTTLAAVTALTAIGCTDEYPVAAGQRFVADRGCADCHRGPDGNLSGSATARPGTTAYPSNLTSDRTTGLGAWADVTIVRADPLRRRRRAAPAVRADAALRRQRPGAPVRRRRRGRCHRRLPARAAAGDAHRHPRVALQRTRGRAVTTRLVRATRLGLLVAAAAALSCKKLPSAVPTPSRYFDARMDDHRFVVADHFLASIEMQISGEPFAQLLGRNLAGYDRFSTPTDLYTDPKRRHHRRSAGYSMAVESYEYSKQPMNNTSFESGAGLSLAVRPALNPRARRRRRVRAAARSAAAPRRAGGRRRPRRLQLGHRAGPHRQSAQRLRLARLLARLRRVLELRSRHRTLGRRHARLLVHGRLRGVGMGLQSSATTSAATTRSTCRSRDAGREGARAGRRSASRCGSRACGDQLLGVAPRRRRQPDHVVPVADAEPSRRGSAGPRSGPAGKARSSATCRSRGGRGSRCSTRWTTRRR